MDIGKIQRLNDLTKEYKEFNVNEDPTSSIKKEESPEITESEKNLRKLHFGVRYNKDAIDSLKETIEGLKSEIKELRQKHKEQVQRNFNSDSTPSSEEAQKEEQKTIATEDNTKKMIEPIDRNNTAPADVSIEKIFYCGEK